MMDAVILAGGKGTRLKPYTVSIPKPLVPLGEDPIIEILLRQLAAEGFDRIHITLGHLGSMMKAFFEDVKLHHDIDIVFSSESKPLGTFGPVTQLKDLSDDFLLLNGDILTTMSFDSLARYHAQEGCAATVAVHQRQVPIDYGVLDVDLEARRVTGHREKPTLDLFVGMGIYVFRKSVLHEVPHGVRLDVPDVLHRLLDGGESIACYRSDDYWMDIGRPDDYAKAFEDYTSRQEDFLPTDVGHRAAEEGR